jgi:hypothetical protein
MPDMFGFDAKTLSNDDLFTKQVDLTRKKVMAARLGRMDAISQLDIMIRAIDAERQERMFLDRYKKMPSSPVVVESDPSLREAEIAVEEINAPKTNSGRPVRRTIRSATPVLPPTEGV